MPAEKTAITFEPRLMRDVKSAAVETTGGNVSAWLADAARAKLRHENLQELVQSYEAEHGAFTEEEISEVQKEWPA